MTSLQELREKRAAAWATAEEYAERSSRGENISVAEETAWKRALDEVDRLGTEIGHKDRAGALNEIDGVRSDGMGRSGGYRDSGPEGDAFRGYLRTGNEAELRAQGVGTGSAGGFAVPEGFRATVTETMEAFGGLRRLAEAIMTDAGNDLPWPTNDDTANEGVAELAENTQMAEQDVTFGQAQLSAYVYASGVVKVSLQLLQDAGFPIDSWLARKLGERIGRRQAGRWVTGSGSGQPQGITVGGTVGVTATATGAVTYDELVDLQASVDAAYTDGGQVPAGQMTAPQQGVAWVMHQLTLAELRKLTDTQNRPLIAPDVQGRAPTTLLGYPIVIDNGMPTIAASAIPIAFGNFRAGYVIRDVRQVSVQRLDERYADFLQVGFLAHQRADGLVQDASAFKLLEMAAA